MSMDGKCSRCGAPIPTSVPGRRCPKCLLEFALDPEAAEAEQPADSWPRTSRSAPKRVHYFGDYELLQEMARGGMGVVWKARQVSLNRIVAVKLLLAGKFSSKEFVKRFQAEAEAAANLQHPNIVAIYEVGEQEGQHYFSMEFVEGQSLAERARKNPLPPEQAAGYINTLAEAIHYAHQRGILHRDIKPSNILIDALDRPRVTDFGLAKRLNEDSDMTLSGQVLGTPHYMSPEQAQGRRAAVTVASDVYSLGAVLYYSLAGRPIFDGETVEGVLEGVLNREPTSLRVLNPRVPRDLETICLRCLNKEPSRRYPSALALAEDLTHWLKHEPIQARSTGPGEKLWRWCRRKPALASLALALHLVAGAGLAGILWQWHRANLHAANETAHRLRAEQAVTMLELQRAEDLLEKDEVVMGVAYLARMLRQQPTNQLAARRLLSALTQREFALPVGAPLAHGKKVTYAEFSPDDRRVATASLDFTARVWDARTGEPLTAPMRHPDGVRLAQFSSDGERILTLSDDFRARLWEAATGRAVGQPMPGIRRSASGPWTVWPTTRAQFNPDGQRVITASDDGTARIWDGRTGQPLLQLRHESKVSTARFSSDGKRIVTACDDKTARIWDAETGWPLANPFRHPKRVTAAHFSPDSRWVMTTCDDYITRVWEVASGQMLPRPAVPLVQAIQFSPDGERGVEGSQDGETLLWAVRDGKLLCKPLKQHALICSAEFSPEGQRILTSSWDSTARLWDGAGGEPLAAPMQHNGQVCCARLSNEGLFAVTASADGTARIWDIRLGRARSEPITLAEDVFAAEFSPKGDLVVITFKGGARIWSLRLGKQQGQALEHTEDWVQFSPDGNQVATSSLDHTARIWDAHSGLPLTAPLRHEHFVTCLEFSPDGLWLATGSVDHTVRVWNTRTGQSRFEPIPHRSDVRFVRFSPDGRLLLSADGEDDSAQLRDAASGRLIAQTPQRAGQIWYAEFSRDGRRVLTASEDGSARIWDSHTCLPLGEAMWHKSSVICARFSPDGRWVVTASDDTTARIWDSQTSQPVGEPMRHQDSVKGAEFSPDGLLVLTASFDGTARLWDARTGRPVAEPFQHGDKVVSAHFSPDGRRVLTAAASNGARLWDVPPMVPGEDSSGRALAGTLLADLAEGVIGKHVNAQGALESVPASRLSEVRQRIGWLPPKADFAQWLEWFFADRSSRVISPYSQIAMPNYITSLAASTNLTSLREALMLCPTNGLAFAKLAQHHLKQSPSPDSSDAVQADWASRQAVKFAPLDPRIWECRVEVVLHIGGWTNLLEESDRMLQSYPESTAFWNGKARAFEGMEQFEAALQACDRALESLSAHAEVQSDQPLREEALQRRARALECLGQKTKAEADKMAAH